MRRLSLLPLAIAVACSSAKPTSTDTRNMTAAENLADIHSCARPDEVVVRHLELDLTLDFAAKIARGTCALTLDRKLASAPLWLDTQDLAIESVLTDAGASVPFKLGARDPILATSLRIDLPKGCTHVTLHYATRPNSAAMQWLDPAQTKGGKEPFLFTQGQAILTRSWIPLQDSPGVRATWRATIHAPAALRPLMSATTRGGDAKSGYTFAMDKPVPSYLIALACGDLAERQISKRCAVWAEAAMIESAAAELEDMERMVASCEAQFGSYRWGRYDVLVLPPSFPFGGMENPCLTFATPTILAGDKSLVSLIAHELAHSWSGNLVTNATWRDFWLNEGFTVYVENRIMESLYGIERANMETVLAMKGLAEELKQLPPADQILHVDLTNRNPDDGMTGVPYEKGAAFLRLLEQQFGRARFDAFLRTWFDQHAFQSVTTAEFEAWLQRELFAKDAIAAQQIDLAAWIHQPGLPVNAPTPQSQAFVDVDRLRAEVMQRQSADSIRSVQWNTQQWLRFLDGFDVNAKLLAEVDESHHFTQSGNCEIVCAWLQLAIAADYLPAMPRLEDFLLNVGRRKYVRPLYERLNHARDGNARAIAIYQLARPHYHAVTVRTLDEYFGWQPK
ncbi:aminopeptidase [Planctomycetota bacterium]|nr:aminopeptidase [Planctomycetota bacterium]